MMPFALRLSCISVAKSLQRLQSFMLLTLDSTATAGRCLAMDGSDGRTYVALGKLFMQQRRHDEARQIYEEGSTATGEGVQESSSLLVEKSPSSLDSALLERLLSGQCSNCSIDFRCFTV